MTTLPAARFSSLVPPHRHLPGVPTHDLDQDYMQVAAVLAKCRMQTTSRCKALAKYMQNCTQVHPRADIVANRLTWLLHADGPQLAKQWGHSRRVLSYLRSCSVVKRHAEAHGGASAAYFQR